MGTARLLAAVSLLLSAAPAWADEAEDAFNSLYGKDYSTATATPDKADDVALALRMLTGVKVKGISPALVAILCDRVYELGAKTPGGYDAAMEAMEILVDEAPDKTLACWQKILAVRQKKYDSAGGASRALAGEVLVEALVYTAGLMSKTGSPTEAAGLYRRAETVARAGKSDRAGEIRARQNALVAREKAEKLATELQAKLVDNPKDIAARKALIRAYLVDLDDPARANAFVDESCDQGMRKYVPVVSKGVEAAPELACMELAEWYRGLGEEASPAAKEAMFVRAKAYYGRFLTLHETQDVMRSQAAVAMKKMEETLVRLGPTAFLAKETIGPGRWVDVLEASGPAKGGVAGQWTVLEGQWTRTDGQLVAKQRDAKNFRNAILSPYILEGSYELQATILRVNGNASAGFTLPVGSSEVAALFGFDNQESSFWGIQTGSPTVRGGTLVYGREYAFGIRVQVIAERAEINVTLDGKPFLHWQGPQSALSAPPRPGPAEAKRLALSTQYGETRFGNIRLRMLSGKARLLR
jgi:hypothetical protein